MEICVKQVKHLIFKSIKTIILDYFDFNFIIGKTINLINKRQIAFKEGLRSMSLEQVPEASTPEILLKGYDTCSLNVIPELQPVEIDDSLCSGCGSY